jgi:polyphosphate kinase 2
MGSERTSTKDKATARRRDFDLDDPELPAWVAEAALTAGGYPYEEQLRKKDYQRTVEPLQVELVKLLGWQLKTGRRSILVFEGRDAAGKGGAIKAVREHLNPRHARIVALAKPSDKEAGEWYFQRYAEELPTAGEIVLFDRSWYNRGVVEPVMGYCTEDQATRFLDEAPSFERMLASDAIPPFKFWMEIGRETQLERFHARRHDPLKQWKISPVDIQAIDRWDAFTAASRRMIEATHTSHAPWIVVRANDKRRAHLNLIRYVLRKIDYEGRDLETIGDVDRLILGEGPAALPANP